MRGRAKRKRQIIAEGRGAQSPGDQHLTQYELERAERIKRNQEIIKQLGLQRLVGEVHQCIETANARHSHAPRTSQPRQPKLQSTQPSRRSNRRRTSQPEESTDASRLDKASTLEDQPVLMGCKEYFAAQGKAMNGFEVKGYFRGWVNPDVCDRYGLESPSHGAIEALSKGQKAAIACGLKGKGWSNVRAYSSTLLAKNPNAFFYRHVAPHEQQAGHICEVQWEDLYISTTIAHGKAQGDWTEEEHDLFLQTARAHGAGDKWGLFASYIPQRVGYQCSAYYRDVIIPQGLIYDPKYRMNSSDKAVYVG